MVRTENHCCDCAVPGYPCQGRSCPLRNVEVHYCDNCGDYLEYINELDGKELCDACIEKLNEENETEE